jgi:hypothetical protein
MTRRAARGSLAAAGGALLIALSALDGAGQGRSPDAARGPESGLVDRIGWLAGCWEGTLSSGAVYEEMWLAPRGGTISGMARMTREGRTLSFEFMRIAVGDQGVLVYTAQPSGGAPTHFTGTEVGPDRAVFENAGHDFPQRILYRLAPPDGLHARIEGERDGQLRGIDFPLSRVACPG